MVSAGHGELSMPASPNQSGHANPAQRFPQTDHAAPRPARPPVRRGPLSGAAKAEVGAFADPVRHSIGNRT